MSILHQFANTLSKPTGSSTNNENANLCPQNTNNFLQFIETYGKRVEELDNEKHGINQEKTKNQEHLETAKNNLKTLNVSNFTDF